MAKILLVKTSSLGDVIHELPALTDIRRAFPDAQVDWVVEEGFRELPALHPGVRAVIPVAIRRWRRAPLRRSTWREMAEFLRGLQREPYDLILDSQGLIKSALISLLAHGPRCGYDRLSVRESLASLLYQRRIAVARQLHAVERNRSLAGNALGYIPSGAVDYGLCVPLDSPKWLPEQPYVVLLHATTRADKEWLDAHWLALGAEFNRKGLTCVLPWGSEQEHEHSQRLAQQLRASVVPPRISLGEAAVLLAGARAVVGVDTGLTHLAAALNTPVVALYCASDPGLTGVYCSGPAVNLGGLRQMPTPEQVLSALAPLVHT